MKWTPKVVVTAVLIAFVGVAPALAGSYRGTDATNDVLRFPIAGGPMVADSNRANGDLKSIKITYAGGRVGIVVGLRELRRSPRKLQVRTELGYPHQPDTDQSVVIIDARQGAWGGRARGTGAVSDCDIRHRLNYEQNRIRVGFDADCLDDPRWIRAEFALFMHSHRAVFLDYVEGSKVKVTAD